MKTLAAFVLGFAAGMVCLAAGLWSTGSLLPGHALAAPKVPEAVQVPQPAAGLPPFQPPRTSPAATPKTTPAPSSPSPDDRPALGMPVPRVDPPTLRSNFSQTRGGHAHEALD